MKNGEIIPLAVIAISSRAETVAIILSYDKLQEGSIVNKVQRSEFMELTGIKQMKTWQRKCFTSENELLKNKNFIVKSTNQDSGAKDGWFSCFSITETPRLKALNGKTYRR